MKEELEMVKKNIASKLRGLRAEEKLSRNELALKTGIDIGTLVRYENGDTTQNLDKLIVLANYYNVNLVYFFSQNYENMYRYNKIQSE